MLNPLKSRKVRTAIVGAFVSLAARYGFDVDPTVIACIIALFASVILGVAIEDNGKHAAKRLIDPSLVPAAEESAETQREERGLMRPSAVSRPLSAWAVAIAVALGGGCAGLKASAVGQAAVRATNTRIEARDITVQGDFVTSRVLAFGLAAVVPLGGMFYWLAIRPAVRPHRILKAESRKLRTEN